MTLGKSLSSLHLCNEVRQAASSVKEGFTEETTWSGVLKTVQELVEAGRLAGSASSARLLCLPSLVARGEVRGGAWP